MPDRSPLTDAISDVQPGRVRSLLEAGADPNLREGDDATWWPPLALAMRGRGYGSSSVSEDEAKAQQEIVDLLLARGADANIRWCGDDDEPRCNENNGITPLMYASILGDEELADKLTRHGADASLRDWRGLTASDYWGVKTTVGSWCAAPRRDEPLLNDAQLLLEGKLWENDNADILAALREAPDRSIEVVTDQHICEVAAAAYARRRMTDPTDTTPRSIVPVLVVRVGRLWLVDDLRDRDDISETAVFSNMWRLLGWGMTGS